MERLVSRANSATVAMATAIAVIASAALIGAFSDARHTPAKGVASWSLRGAISIRDMGSPTAAVPG